MDEAASRFWKEDASAAVENMLLAAVALGHDALSAGAAQEQEDYDRSVPAHRRLLAIIPVGRPAQDEAQADKKSLSEVLHRGRYGRLRSI